MRHVRFYRRPATLFAYWRHGELAVRDVASGVERLLEARDVALVDTLTRWTSAAAAARALGWRRREVAAALERLTTDGLLERADRPPDRRRSEMASWAEWSPEAAVFHFGTKDVRRTDLETVQAELADRIAIDPPPPPLKRGTGRTPIRLPPSRRSGPLARVLLARRSWRQFSAAPIRLGELATLLGLTWGVQRWMRVNGEIQAALKTSPSAGACHPIEAYVVVQRVTGLAPGIFHYEPDAHALTLVRRGAGESTVRRMLNGQRWFDSCAAVCVMTAVFPRVQWKYQSARAYRTVLLDAGHLCQTFCLVATSLGLAPFCSASIADSHTERLLGVDGVRESVVYAAGVGRRPRGARWAPWPGDMRKPPTAPPKHR